MESSFQKNTEKHLAQIKSTFEKDNDLSYEIFQQMPIGICITNDQGNFTDVNTTYCDLYGYSKDELIGKPFTVVVPDQYKDMLLDMHKRFLEQEYELQGRWTVQNKQNTEFEIISNAAFLFNEETQEKKKMTLVVKASELELTIQRLQTTIEILENKINTQDIANRLAEHDMRNRIGSMVSIADILSKGNLDAQQKKWVLLLKDIGADTIRLLTSAKDFALMERGEYVPKIESFDLINVIAGETKAIRHLLADKEIELVLQHHGQNIEPGEDSIMIEGDQFYLEHLIQNLLRNAVEASPSNEIIKIAIVTDNVFTIKISNKGVIPKSIRNNFFEKYITSGKEGGTGLGTYISKMIAQMHSGSLSFLTSEAEGTTLILKLPNTLLKIK